MKYVFFCDFVINLCVAYYNWAISSTKQRFTAPWGSAVPTLGKAAQ
jgi:hypothetical protein